jgi:hypothetical protein
MSPLGSDIIYAQALSLAQPALSTLKLLGKKTFLKRDIRR